MSDGVSFCKVCNTWTQDSKNDVCSICHKRKYNVWMMGVIKND